MRFLTVAAFFISTSALACPNLAGHYPVCRSQSGQSESTETIITQSVSNRVTTYKVTSTPVDTNESETSIYVANGKTVIISETFPDSDLKVSLETTASCAGNTLNITEKMVMNGVLMATMTQKITKTGNALNVKIHMVAMDEEVRDVIICE